MQEFHMYVAACVSDGGIYHYVYRQGALREVSKTPVDRPMYLALEGNRLYAVLREPFENSPNSGVCSWELDGNGELHSQTELLSTQGRCGCHLTVRQGQVYVANYLSGSACLLPQGTVAEHTGSGVHPTRQQAPHVHFVGFTPDEKWLLSVDLGIDTIMMYAPDLQVMKPVQMPEGHGCRHLAWSEDGRHCFCINELASSLTVLGYDGDTLTVLDAVLVRPENWRETNTAAAIRVVEDRIYFSIRGCDRIGMVTYREGAFSEPIFVSSEGKSPRDIHIMGDKLFAANESSDCVTVFDLDHGGLTFTGERISIPSPLCIVFHQPE